MQEKNFCPRVNSRISLSGVQEYIFYSNELTESVQRLILKIALRRNVGMRIRFRRPIHDDVSV